MGKKTRKFEVHRLTISGTLNGVNYGNFLVSTRKKAGKFQDKLILPHSRKSHALYSAKLLNHRLRLKFLSFTTGFRPDIVDTKNYSISSNPLKPTQTGVEWTHVLGRKIKENYFILIESFQAGINANTIEDYLQWMVDEFNTTETVLDDDEIEPITISLEAEVDEVFIHRIDSLTRVSKAVVRTTRPNPGWDDLENDLADVAQKSDAHKAEISMTARRSQSLSMDQGIVGAIRNLFNKGNLNFASIKGQRDNKSDFFSTESLGKHIRIKIELDENGQIKESDIWKNMSLYLDSLE